VKGHSALRKLLCLLAGTSTVTLAALAAAAAQFPNKPLRWISPYAAGGGSDLTTRAVALKLSEFVGQTVVVDNRTGASGKIAVELASRSPADGYTLVTITPSISANQDIRDLSPLTQMTNQGYVWIVHPSVPATSIMELVALARAKPGTLHYGSSGIATMQHIAGAMLGTMTKTDLVHVPYKGGAPALADLLGGQLQFFAGDMWSSVPHIKSGKVRALAVTSPKRSTIFPDLPTTAEAGVPGYGVENWYGVAAHARTPADILLRLNKELVRALRSPEVNGRIAQEGAHPIGNSAAEFSAIIRHDVQRWRAVAKEAGIKAE
jgi:tripartite-type tricarboxylate transporter receptor subunit TctC